MKVKEFNLKFNASELFIIRYVLLDIITTNIESKQILDDKMKKVARNILDKIEEKIVF